MERIQGNEGGRQTPPSREATERRVAAIGDVSRKAGDLRDFHPVNNPETAAAIASFRTLCAKLEKTLGKKSLQAPDSVRADLLSLAKVVLVDRAEWERVGRAPADDRSAARVRAQVAEATRVVERALESLKHVLSDVEAVSVEALRKGEANPISREETKSVRELRNGLSDWLRQWRPLARSARQRTAK